MIAVAVQGYDPLHRAALTAAAVDQAIADVREALRYPVSSFAQTGQYLGQKNVPEKVREKALAALDALEAQATGRATGGRTGAAATVDQAIADVEKALRWMAEYRMTGTEQTLHIDFQGKAIEVLPALRVLADAVEELRGCPFCLFVPVDRDELASHLNGCTGRMGYGGINALEQMQRAEAAEAENVRLAAQVESLRSWIKDSQDYKRAERLARQVADLEAALDAVQGEWTRTGRVSNTNILRARAALSAARSRDPQEPQT